MTIKTGRRGALQILGLGLAAGAAGGPGPSRGRRPGPGAPTSPPWSRPGRATCAP